MWLLAILNRYSENDYGELNHENYTDKTIPKYEIENLNLVAYGIEYGKRRTIYFDYDNIVYSFSMNPSLEATLMRKYKEY